MRLTLRTMLAYLDEILEPDDAEEIGKKIAESEQATNIMHYLRDCMRRTRVKAPPLYGRGLASDANSVAEYLDNTLADDRVAEFEKICLDSESHIAEVASCHQVLTLVLGEPADIDPAARERMYQLPTHVEAAEAAASGAVAADGDLEARTLVPPPPRKRPRPEVPEYLRSSRSALWPIAAVAAVVAILTAGGLLYWQNLDVRRLIGMVQENSVGPENPGPAIPVDQTPVGPSAQIAPVAPSEGEPNGSGLPPVEQNTLAGNPSAPPQPSVPPQPGEPGSGSEPVAMPDEGNASPGDEEGLPDAPAPTVVPGARQIGKTAPPMPETPDEGDPTPTSPEPDKGAAPAPTDVASNDVRLRPGGALDPGIAESGSAKPDANPGDDGVEVGRSASPDQLLLAYDPKSEQWRRLAARATLRSGMRLRSLPTFRPLVTLSAGISVVPHETSSFILESPDAKGVPDINVEYGRLQIMTDGKPDNKIRVQLGDRTVVVTFKDAEAIMGLDVRQVLEPGADPAETPATVAADVYAVAGVITWEEEGVPVDMQAPDRRSLTEIAASPGESTAFPDEEISSAERRAQTAIKEKLATDRSLSLGLKEIYSAPRPKIEEQTLALRCAGCIDDFEICVQALDSTDLRIAWPEDLRTLQAALARGPEVAGKMRADFEKERGQANGAALYRMLWGYTRSQLKDGAAQQLINDALREDTSFRVLCSWNLQEILGLSMQSVFYHPSSKSPAAATAARADQQWQRTIKSWRNRLQEEKLLSGGTPNSKKAARTEK